MKQVKRKVLLGIAAIRRSFRAIVSLRYIGRGRYCPLCETEFSRFLAYGNPVRKDAMCPRCGSLERHRFLWLFLKEKTDFFSCQYRKMLHIAPEKCYESKFRNVIGSGYLTADLHNSRAMEKMDITDIPYPNESFDIIYCSHVLEHIPDDQKALRELHRVLKSDGWAILLVPIEGEITYEDPTIVSPEARLKAFGQIDHVRIYGNDYFDRLEKAGFKTTRTTVQELFIPTEVKTMALSAAAGEIFYSEKI